MKTEYYSKASCLKSRALFLCPFSIQERSLKSP
uniref:Uncharacterized protein n=1 Tax=Siphoviridae sp. ct3o911 TaxID=2827560 RepID=A0A8S5LJE4_9CAUD|nr:MAG TPA: hypothetical protein [Siphoviridae sp. ct3o911]